MKLEPKYQPFESFKSLVDAVKEHGDHIRKSTGGHVTYIIGMGVRGDIIVKGICGLLYLYPPKIFLNLYVFESDGSPCGEIAVEETKNE